MVELCVGQTFLKVCLDVFFKGISLLGGMLK
jgi:hypothetical protein